MTPSSRRRWRVPILDWHFEDWAAWALVVLGVFLVGCFIAWAVTSR